MRKLATIRVIDDINSIEGADSIEVATVGGWKVVVKKGEFTAGDKVVYFELDSWIPNSVAPFLTKPGQFPKVYNGVEGERLKTIRLRGQISQGLLIPKPVGLMDAEEGDDLSEYFGIQKWEAPVSAQLAGLSKGSFPTLVPKTDQERVQNLSRSLEKWREQALTFEVTEKLDGSSCTMYLDLDNEFHVCSRNLNLRRDENNSFWKVAIHNNVESRMVIANLEGMAIQGELVGEGIQGNKYGIKGHEFFVFDIYDTKTGKYLSGIERVKICNELGLRHVPVLFTSMSLKWENLTDTTEAILSFAEGKSALNVKTEREGIVFKCEEDPGVSFKAISNKFLLKNGD